MRTFTSPPWTRRGMVLVAVLVALGVLASVGVGHAAGPGPAPAAAAATDDRSGGDGPDGKKDGGKKDDGKKDDERPICPNGKRDDNPDNGICTDNRPTRDPNLVSGTPCTKSARACVDLNANKAWLIENEKVLRGPVRIAHGGPGYETPRGTFAVQWKNKDHRSMEFDNAPMPFAVFFTDGGVAFHQGDLGSNSHGCVRLARDDAEAFFNFLKVDDQVQVH